MNEARLLKALKDAARKHHGQEPPQEGTLDTILYGDLDNDGCHWQVQIVHDRRFRKEPWIAVYCWVYPKGGGKIRHSLQGDRNGKSWGDYLVVDEAEESRKQRLAQARRIADEYGFDLVPR